MTAVVQWLEALFDAMPLPVLEVWGLASYVLGLVLAVLAFGGFTLRTGGSWRLGRERQSWDAQAFLSMPLTFVLILGSGYLGSFVVLVPGAQTLESLKDLVVLSCVVLFGYPALVIVPFAYGLSDLIEGVPPEFLLSWLPGYFINPACFWLAYQLFGKNPDFRRARTWARYAIFVTVFLSIEPALWGHLCADEFTPAVSYRTVTPALFFTTAVTWLLAPVVMLGALPLARRAGLFWADIEGHVKERAVGEATWEWEAGTVLDTRRNLVSGGRLPIRMVILAPFIALMLLMVATTAYVAHESNLEEASRVATAMHRRAFSNVALRLDGAETGHAVARPALERATAGETNPIVIFDGGGRPLHASGGLPEPVRDAVTRGVRERLAGLAAAEAGVSFSFDHVSRKPLSRETYLVHAAQYRDARARGDLLVASVMPQARYLEGVRAADRRSAVVLAVALVLSLLLAAVVSGLVAAPIRRVADGARALARGELEERVPESRWEEANALAESFNHMAARLERSFNELVGEVDVRKKRERELEASESRLRVSEDRVRLAVKAARLGIWDWDLPKNEFVWDDSMYRLYGVEKTTFQTGYDAWKRCLVPEDAARAIADVEAARKGERDFASEFRIRRPDGAVRVLRGRGETYRDASGVPVRMVGVNWDVTEQLEAEQELRRHRDHLEDLIRERTLELQAAKEQADGANRAKSAFLANMSHEIRTPMNAILGFGQLMRRDSELSTRDRERLERILASGEHLLELINNVLDMSKIEAGRMDVRAATFDLHAAIRDVDAMIRVRAESKGLALDVEGAAELPRYVRSDAAKLRQMLLNVLGNAVKFTQTGRVKLSAEARPSEQGAHLTFRVEDTGVGIAAAELGSVFEPFGQTQSGIAARSGTGLGMPITRDFARMLGGDLTVSSELGAGTTFVLTLDVELGALSDLSRTKRAAGVVRLAPGERPPKVLVVDDEEDNRVVLVDLLTSAGLAVTVAADGLEALDRFAAERPDFVFMDIKMPRMDGIEAIRRIRKRADGAKVPIVALSASVYEKESDSVVRQGANSFVAKPFREQQIWDVIEAELGVKFDVVPPETAAPVSLRELGRDQLLALGEANLSAFRAAVANGDVDRAAELLSTLEGRHDGVVAALRRKLSEFDIEGLLAITSVHRG
ncbi:MAG TPA: response regulator [Polyangiaceae bacterium]